MRYLALAVVAAILLASSPASAILGRDLSMTIIAIDERANVIVWEPDPEAIFYELYRGSTMQHVVKIAETSLSFYIDEMPPPGDTWYVVKSIHASPHGDDGANGSCVERSGTTGVSVSTSSCV